MEKCLPAGRDAQDARTHHLDPAPSPCAALRHRRRLNHHAPGTYNTDTTGAHCPGPGVNRLQAQKRQWLQWVRSVSTDASVLSTAVQGHPLAVT